MGLIFFLFFLYLYRCRIAPWIVGSPEEPRKPLAVVKKGPWEASSLMSDFYFKAQIGTSVISKQSLMDALKSAAVFSYATKSKVIKKKKIKNSLGMRFVYIPPGFFMTGSALSPSEVEKDMVERQ